MRYHEASKKTPKEEVDVSETTSIDDTAQGAMETSNGILMHANKFVFKISSNKSGTLKHSNIIIIK
jgi:hypothetical protein